MNSTSILSVNNLSKTYHSKYGETLAIKNINFNVNKGEFIGIIGPSGCGKSSILNILCLLDNEYSGEIKFKKNIKIAYMLQEDALFPWLTILDNVLIGLKIKRELNSKSKEYALSLLKKYGLYEFKDKYPNELSGGMKQRVALIRTLAIKPNILLLDEPFSALDYQTRLKVSDDVYKIIKEEKKTVIIVTHDISEAISMCDKIIVLSKRPSIVKNIYDIDLCDKSTPIKNREASNFSYYYKLLWKEIDDNVT
jgi:NitT/TauT family transport system ATP-binding protein